MVDITKSNNLGLNDLLKLFENDITVSDITSSKLLGNISAAIVKRRIDLKMTQNEFAKYVNVSQGMVSKWEGGDYNFSIKTLVNIAEKLDMDLNVFISKHKSDIEVKRLEDISYVVSKKTAFVGKKSKVIDFESLKNSMKKLGKLEM